MAGILGKRKPAVLTLGKKLEIAHSLEKVASQRVVGEKFSIAKSIIADIGKILRRYLMPSLSVSLLHSPTKSSALFAKPN